MIRAKLCFAASAVVRDADSNSISAFNILEGIAAVGFPLFIQFASYFVLWERNATDAAETAGTFTLAIDGEQLSTAQISLNFGGNLRHRTTMNVNGLVVPHPGNLRFRLELAEGQTADYVVDVTALPATVQVQH